MNRIIDVEPSAIREVADKEVDLLEEAPPPSPGLTPTKTEKGRSMWPVNSSGTMTGGYRGGGRPKGVKNRATIEREHLDEMRKNEILAMGISPLEYMLQVLRAEPDPKKSDEDDVTYYLRIRQSKKDRMEAAIAAAPYIHPRLAQIELSAKQSSQEDALDELE